MFFLQSTEQKLHPGGQGYHQHSGGSADSNTDRSNTGGTERQLSFFSVKYCCFNGALLTAYLYLLNPYCYSMIKERTDPGTSMYRVDSELVKRLRGNLTKDSHVTAQARH